MSTRRSSRTPASSGKTGAHVERHAGPIGRAFRHGAQLLRNTGRGGVARIDVAADAPRAVDWCHDRVQRCVSAFGRVSLAPGAGGDGVTREAGRSRHRDGRNPADRRSLHDPRRPSSRSPAAPIGPRRRPCDSDIGWRRRRPFMHVSHHIRIASERKQVSMVLRVDGTQRQPRRAQHGSGRHPTAITDSTRGLIFDLRSSQAGTGRFLERRNSGLNSFDW